MDEDYAINAELARENEQDPTCVHGLSEWLCADPVSHYPREG